MGWKSEGLTDENIKPPTTSGNSLITRLDHFNSPKFEVEFNGSCLKPDRISLLLIK